MSDLSSLSDEYSVNADFANLVTDVVLRLKIMGDAMETGAPEPSDNAAEALARAASIGRSVRLALGAEHGRGPIEVPEDVLARLQARHEGKRDWFLQDLKSLEDAAGANSPLTDAQIATLDEICDAADSAASAVFRRLWRR